MRTHIIICVVTVVSLLKVKEEKAIAQIAYPYVREADVMWSKTIWRTIDLREKFNFPLYYPTYDLPDRISLFRVIQKGILEEKITKIFSYDAFTNEFGPAMTKAEVQKAMTETIEVRDSVGNVRADSLGNPITMQDTISADRIAQYWVKEEWFFDKQRSVMEVRIIGLAPVIEKEDPATDRFSYQPLFWLYYPDCRDYFSKHKCFNPYNDTQRVNFDQVFSKRLFGSFIREESNVYGRTITSYAQGMDALLESERIKENLLNFEEDLWHH